MNALFPLVLAALVATPLAHAQTPDSTKTPSTVPSAAPSGALPSAAAPDTARVAKAATAKEAWTSAEVPLTRPTWGESAMGAGGVLAGTTLGGLAGLTVGYLVCTARVGCNDLGDVGVIILPVVVGAVGGGYMGARLMRTGYGRGSASGAFVGYLVGSTVMSAALNQGDVYSPVAGLASLAGALGGGALGFRYGPGAHGRGRRSQMAVVPVAAPHGAGAYAVVRF